MSQLVSQQKELKKFDEHNSFADQRHVGYGFLSVVIHNYFTISFEMGFPSFFGWVPSMPCYPLS